MINWLQKIISLVFGPRSLAGRGDDLNSTLQNQPVKPDVHFRSMSIVDKTPKNESVGKEDFIAVVYQNKPLWVLFRCPCGCGNVTSLSLQNIHKPNWTVKRSAAGRPTLYPSIWKNIGCCSHYWIKDGCVYWCNNTGVEPWVAEPRYYVQKSATSM